MRIDQEQLHTDIMKKLGQENKTQAELCEELGMSRNAIRRLLKHEVRVLPFFKLCHWVGVLSYKYVKI